MFLFTRELFRGTKYQSFAATPRIERCKSVSFLVKGSFTFSGITNLVSVTHVHRPSSYIAVGLIGNKEHMPEDRSLSTRPLGNTDWLVPTPGGKHDWWNYDSGIGGGLELGFTHL